MEDGCIYFKVMIAGEGVRRGLFLGKVLWLGDRGSFCGLIIGRNSFRFFEF